MAARPTATRGRDERPTADGALFAYGTLIFDEVMAAVTGEAGASLDAVLPGFERRLLRGAVYPGIAPRDGSEVHGRAWTGLGAEAFARLDRFEGPMYRRETHRVVTRDGLLEAQVYVVRPGYRWMMTARSWDPGEFRARSLARYAGRVSG